MIKSICTSDNYCQYLRSGRNCGCEENCNYKMQEIYMGMDLTKKEYIEFIQRDVNIVNQCIPDCRVRDHIKLILFNSIDDKFPLIENKPNTNICTCKNPDISKRWGDEYCTKCDKSIKP